MYALFFALATPAALAADAAVAPQTVSVGQVLEVQAELDRIVVREDREGRAAATELKPRYAGALAALQPGDTVLVYREAEGDLVVPAR